MRGNFLLIFKFFPHLSLKWHRYQSLVTPSPRLSDWPRKAYRFGDNTHPTLLSLCSLVFNTHPTLLFSCLKHHPPKKWGAQLGTPFFKYYMFSKPSTYGSETISVCYNHYLLLNFLPFWMMMPLYEALTFWPARLYIGALVSRPAAALMPLMPEALSR